MNEGENPKLSGGTRGWEASSVLCVGMQRQSHEGGGRGRGRLNPTLPYPTLILPLRGKLKLSSSVIRHPPSGGPSAAIERVRPRQEPGIGREPPGSRKGRLTVTPVSCGGTEDHQRAIVTNRGCEQEQTSSKRLQLGSAAAPGGPRCACLWGWT